MFHPVLQALCACLFLYKPVDPFAGVLYLLCPGPTARIRPCLTGRIIIKLKIWPDVSERVESESKGLSHRHKVTGQAPRFGCSPLSWGTTRASWLRSGSARQQRNSALLARRKRNDVFPYSKRTLPGEVCPFGGAVPVCAPLVSCDRGALGGLRPWTRGAARPGRGRTAGRHGGDFGAALRGHVSRAASWACPEVARRPPGRGVRW